jgi:hypothetical protein
MLVRIARRHLQWLSPVYVIARPGHTTIRTIRHAITYDVTTYFGRVNQGPGHEPSSVFVFRNKALAQDVARGLEAYKSQTGDYPDCGVTTLKLDASEGRDLEELCVKKMSLAQAVELIKGSGVVLSVCFDDVTIHIRTDPHPDWFAKMSTKPAKPEPRAVVIGAWAYVFITLALVLTSAASH